MRTGPAASQPLSRTAIAAHPLRTELGHVRDRSLRAPHVPLSHHIRTTRGGTPRSVTVINGTGHVSTSAQVVSLTGTDASRTPVIPKLGARAICVPGQRIATRECTA